MDKFIQMLDLQLSFLLNLMVGVLAYKLRIITNENRTHFINLVLTILMPALVFHSFRNLTPELLIAGLQVFILATIIYLILYFLGYFIYRDLPKGKREILHYATLINNGGLGGQPLSVSMYGDLGAIYSSIYLVPHRIIMWTLGLKVVEGDAVVTGKSALMKVLRNPSIIAIILGLIRGIFKIPLPEFVDRSFGQMAGTVSPLASIVIGSIIATISLDSLFEKGVLRYLLVRLIFIPLSVLSVTKLIGLDETVIGVLTIMSSMPAPTTAVLLANTYDLDEDLASKITFLSTVLAIITVPIMMLFI